MGLTKVFGKVIAAPRGLQKSIQSKLFVVLFLLGLVSLSVLGSSAVWLARSEVEKEVLQRNQQVAALVSDRVQSYIKTVFDSLHIEARNITMSAQWEYASLVFLKQNSPELYQTISIIDSTGIRFLRIANKSNDPKSLTDVQKISEPASDDPAFEAVKNGKQYFSNVKFRAGTNAPYIICAIPLYTEKIEFSGALVAEINLTPTIELVRNTSSEPNGIVMIIDGQNQLLAHPNILLIGTKFTHTDINKLVTTRPGNTQYLTQDKQYLVGYAPVAEVGWNVVVEQSTEVAFAGINRLMMIVIAITISATVLICVIAIVISRKITRGIRELATAANRITTTGSLDEQIPITSKDEVGELTASFNGMILALRKTRQALEQWNRELGRKVDIRTRELTDTNHRLEETNKELELANKHKSQFLANMSHELRTPLNAIIGFSEVLQDQVVGDLNDKQKRYVNNILNSGRHLLNLVNDVLDLSKVEAGRMELHCEPFDARVIISEVITQLSTLAAKNELEVLTDFDDNLVPLVADRGRFRQIMYNLVSNAIKFTPHNGKITVSSRIECVETNDNPASFLFAVRDTGIGIAKEHQRTIFETFRQVDSSYSRQYQGTGLGLALTRKLIELHGGEIWVESEIGKGSTFTFQIPLETAPILVSEANRSDTANVIVR